MSISLSPSPNQHWQGIQENLTPLPNCLHPLVAAYLGIYSDIDLLSSESLKLMPDKSVQLTAFRILHKAQSLQKHECSIATRSLVKTIIDYIPKEPVFVNDQYAQYAEIMLAQLRETLEKEAKERAIPKPTEKTPTDTQAPSDIPPVEPIDDSDTLLFQEILKRVQDKLNKKSPPPEKLHDVFYALWSSAIRRPNGEKFLRALLKEKQYDFNQVSKHCFIPPSCYIQIARWVWDDNLIEIVKLRLLDNQSHEDRAKECRAWLNNPTIVQTLRTIQQTRKLNMYKLNLTFLPSEIQCLNLRKITFFANEQEELPIEIGDFIISPYYSVLFKSV